MPWRAKLRSPEWLAVSYFSYAAAIAPFYIRAPWRAFLAAAGVAVLFGLSTLWKPAVRDFLPLGAVLLAYREMDWFTPAVRDYHLERTWILWDRMALDQWGLRAAIEKAGPLLPNYLELCYALVYLVGFAGVAVLFANRKRDQIERFLTIYLAGTLGAYAMFPYFPSEPPRVVFPGADMPQAVSAIRSLNLAILGGYGIHSSVFPSAHVSSAFSAAWALFAILPSKRWIGWCMLVYAVSVALATVYGRYHYAADAVAGIGVSIAAYCVCAVVWNWCVL